MTKYLAAAAAALAVMAGFSAWMQSVGVRKEQVRVETIGKKIDARAKVARKKVEAKKPDELQADLRRFCRDCD
jgi:hypothetical protein